MPWKLTVVIMPILPSLVLKRKCHFLWNFHHWRHCKLPFWQLPVQTVAQISSKRHHFRFKERHRRLSFNGLNGSKKNDAYNDVIMGAVAYQITSFTIVYSTVDSDADQRKHQSSAPLAFVREIHRGTVEFPAQMSSNAENGSIWWRHHDFWCQQCCQSQHHANSRFMAYTKITATFQEKMPAICLKETLLDKEYRPVACFNHRLNINKTIFNLSKIQIARKGFYPIIYFSDVKSFWKYAQSMVTGGIPYKGPVMWKICPCHYVIIHWTCHTNTCHIDLWQLSLRH